MEHDMTAGGGNDVLFSTEDGQETDVWPTAETQMEDDTMDDYVTAEAETAISVTEAGRDVGDTSVAAEQEPPQSGDLDASEVMMEEYNVSETIEEAEPLDLVSEHFSEPSNDDQYEEETLPPVADDATQEAPSLEGEVAPEASHEEGTLQSVADDATQEKAVLEDRDAQTASHEEKLPLLEEMADAGPAEVPPLGEVESNEALQDGVAPSTSAQKPHAVRISFNGQDFVMFAQTDPPSFDVAASEADDKDKKASSSAGQGTTAVIAPALALDHAVYFETLDNLFEALRVHEALGDFLEEGTELSLSFEGLEMAVREDDVYAREVTLDDIHRLHAGLAHLGSLHIYVAEGRRFISRYNELATHVSSLLQALPDEVVEGQITNDDAEGDEKGEGGETREAIRTSVQPLDSEARPEDEEREAIAEPVQHFDAGEEAGDGLVGEAPEAVALPAQHADAEEAAEDGEEEEAQEAVATHVQPEDAEQRADDGDGKELEEEAIVSVHEYEDEYAAEVPADEEEDYEGEEGTNVPVPGEGEEGEDDQVYVVDHQSAANEMNGGAEDEEKGGDYEGDVGDTYDPVHEHETGLLVPHNGVQQLRQKRPLEDDGEEDDYEAGLGDDDEVNVSTSEPTASMEATKRARYGDDDTTTERAAVEA